MRFARYLAVQVLAYGLDMGGFLLLLHHAGWRPLAANVAGKLLAGGFAFLAHHHFTFRLGDQQHEGRQVLGYFVLLALNLPLSSAVLTGTLLLLQSPAAAKFCADAICVLLTYWLSKRYVFRRRTSPASGPAPGTGA